MHDLNLGLSKEQDVEKAVSNLVSKNQAPIIRHYDGYIILAQDERDFQSKVSKIQRGDTFGFYTVERALSLKNDNEAVMVSAITASQLKNNSFILSTNVDKEPIIKIGEGYFWYRGEKIEDTKNVYELFADFLTTSST